MRPGAVLRWIAPADLKVIARYLRYLSPFRNLLAFAATLLLMASCLQLVTPLLTGSIIDRILTDRSPSVLHRMAGLLLLITAAYLGTQLARGYLLAKLKIRLAVRMHQQLLRRIARLSFTYVSRKETGYLASRVLDDPGQVYEFSTDTILALLQHSLTFATALLVLLWLSWRTALLALMIVPVYLLIGSLFVDSLRRVSASSMEKQAQRTKVLYEVLAGLYTVNACAAEGQVLRRFLRYQTEVARTQWEQFFLAAKVGLARNFTAALGPLVVFWYGGLMVIAGRLTIGELVAFSAVFGYLFGSVQSLSGLVLSTQKAIVALQRVFEILDTEPEVPQSGSRKLPRLKQGIELRDVCFAYGRGGKALDGINLRIPAGGVVALVGRSGAGKSTIAHLLMRFYDPQSGGILLDGVDLRTFSLQSLRHRIALVPQDVFLFSMTIAENIRLGAGQVSMEEIITAAKLADAHDFITALPDNYDTMVGERGLTLSGGQRQRIAIARALLRDPDVLILDEAVSSVDGASEQVICETVQRLNSSRRITTILIAHRLSTIRQAGLLFFLDQGHLVDQGDHATLLQRCPAYLDLVKFQYRESGGAITNHRVHQGRRVRRLAKEVL